MASYRSLFLAALESAAAVTAIVGQRIYGLHAASTGLPYIIISVLSHEHSPHLRGVSELDHARMRCDLYGEDFNQLVTLEAAVRAAIQGAATFQAQYVFGFELYEDDTKLYHLVLEFSLWHDN